MKNKGVLKNLMLTRFGAETLSKQTPLGEYPRPQMRRDSYLCLNGKWRCVIKDGAGREKYDGEIYVPFSPETLLSGVLCGVKPGDTMTYSAEFEIPEGFLNAVTLLHFGAVDYECSVRFNGVNVGGHKGGYTAFTLDVTGAVKTGLNRITVKVSDPSDTGVQSRGKQKLKSGGIWYTPQSGIWQTAWMESVPSEYVRDFTLIPDIDAGTLTVKFDANATRALVEAYDDGIPAAAAVSKDGIATIVLPGFECWSPEHPKLYDLKITAGEDSVYSYFAMRKFSVGTDGNGVKRLFLNNKPYFHKGVLDQGYWSDGLLTPPSDEAMVYDITLMKKLGFNMLRKHIKIEPARWYYHCDRLGMLVWQDMVCGGGKYKTLAVAVAPFLGFTKDDSNYGFFSRRDKAGREEYERDLADTVKQLKNAPCIAMWVPFNEGWGQFDSTRIAALVKTLDPTRTVDNVSGWYDQGEDSGDFKSLHIYFRAVKLPKDKRVILLSEFGGYSLKVAGHVYDSERSFGYKMLETREDYEKAYADLIENEILPAIPQGLSAVVYTQLSDVEQEINGFVTFDRAAEKADRAAIKAVNDKMVLPS
ncbi:MAG: glycoside hydrolase family 2 [Clostridiales bacterium]|jgi:beta-galactosidase/beta-glucuronidase|nr:glycoside hydrolase family 2 [Clostridiales bacterium]